MVDTLLVQPERDLINLPHETKLGGIRLP